MVYDTTLLEVDANTKSSMLKDSNQRIARLIDSLLMHVWFKDSDEVRWIFGSRPERFGEECALYKYSARRKSVVTMSFRFKSGAFLPP